MKRLFSTFVTVCLILGIALVVPTASASQEPQGIYGTHFARYGDVNLDQAVNASDALSVLQQSVGKATYDDVQALLADVNKDEGINASDALQILQLLVDKIKEFSAGVYYIIQPYEDGDSDATPDKPVVPDENAFFYDTANSYNGAYQVDDTADCSFVMDNTGLKEKTIYSISSSVINSDMDLRRLVISLQGLINRDFGKDDDHTTLVYVVADTADTDWLREMMADGVCADFAKSQITSAEKFYTVFANQLKYCGMVLWDPDVWATANVAATICGVDGYLPVLAGSSVETALTELGVPVKLSLVDMFTGKGTIPGTSQASTGSAKNDAYRWALEKYFPRCSSQYVAYTLDGAVTQPDTGWTNSSNCLKNHDYLIARRAFFFDLDPFTGQAACDDPTQRPGLDAETMRLIFQKRYDRAKGEIGMAMGFPPWWAKYTQEHGGGTLASLQLEPYYTELVTCYNLAMEADAAQPCEMTNGSVYYKYVPLLSEYKNTQPTEKMTFDENVHYFTFYIGDYDSSAWMKKYVQEMWLKKDRKLGKVNMMWSYNPNLSYRIPLMFDYVYRNKSSMDYFAAGDSGAGYVNPSAFYPGITLGASGGQRPASTGNGAAQWVEYCKKFYQRFDLTITGFIINSGNAFDARVMEMYNQFATTGSTYYNGNDEHLLLYKGVPYIQSRIGVGRTADQDASYLYNWAFTSMAPYNFASFRTVSWTPTDILEKVESYTEYAAGKGKTVQYCDPYNFFDLIRQSGQGVVVAPYKG